MHARAMQDIRIERDELYLKLEHSVEINNKFKENIETSNREIERLESVVITLEQ